MRLSSVLLCASALVCASSALAADLLPTKKEPPAPVVAPAPYSWTGFYLGVGGGAAFMNVHSSSESYINDYFYGFDTAEYAFGGEKSDLGAYGAFGTIEVGGDYQINSQFVVGAFADFDLRSLKAKSTSAAAAYCIDCDNTWAFHNVHYSVQNGWDAGVRLGYLVTNRNLLYALGGVTGAQVSSGARLDQDNNYGNHQWVASSESSWKTGWMVGAGWQTAITDHISLKTEYRYQDYGQAKSYYSFDVRDEDSYQYGYAKQSGDVIVQSIRAVLDYKF